MPDIFDPDNLLNLKAFLDPLSINELTATESASKKRFRLDFNLDFSKHFARSVLYLFKNHAFKTLAGFCHTVAGSKNPRILYLLVHILDYDIGSYAKMKQSYLDWEKKQSDYKIEHKQLKQDLYRIEKRFTQAKKS